MLELLHLSKRFGDRVALAQVSLEVRPGRILGFLGPNGAGKTTTMRCIFDLVTPDGGIVTWNGRAVDHAQRLAFGYMPEERGLYPKMKIGEQLTYLARLAGAPRDEAAASTSRWLQRLGLDDRAADRLEALSHGNQQRVQLAAALVHDPALAVLDEPFSGLDPIGVQNMTRELRALAASGSAILFSSHQLDLVEDVCDDVVIINDGRVVAGGTLDELRAAASHRRLSVMVDGAPWQPGSIPFTQVGEGQRRHLLVEESIDPAAVLEEARSAGAVDVFRFEPPTLTDIFHEAVQKSGSTP